MRKPPSWESGCFFLGSGHITLLSHNTIIVKITLSLYKVFSNLTARISQPTFSILDFIILKSCKTKQINKKNADIKIIYVPMAGRRILMKEHLIATLINLNRVA
jgi:hypothetical protein